MIKIKVLEQDPLQSPSELLVAGYSYKSKPLKDYVGRLDRHLNGQISCLIKTGKISGRLGEVTLLGSLDKIPPPKILIVGLGPKENLTPALVQQCCCNLIGVVSGLKLAHISIGTFAKPAKVSAYNDMGHGMIDGILMGYMRNFSNDETLSVSFAEEDKAKYDILYKAVRFAIEHYPRGHGQD